MKSWKLIVVLTLGAVLAAGCGGGDDDDTATKDDKGTAGTSDEKPPEMAEVPMGGVACGNQVCTPQEGSTVTLCCADAFSAKCGMMQGQACVALAMTDPRCPSVMAGGMFMLASCCTDDNMCGIDTSLFNGNKCTELGMAASQAMMMGGGSFITFPPPKACDE